MNKINKGKFNITGQQGATMRAALDIDFSWTR